MPRFGTSLYGNGSPQPPEPPQIEASELARSVHPLDAVTRTFQHERRPMTRVSTLVAQARSHEENEEWSLAHEQYLLAIEEIGADSWPAIGVFNRLGDVRLRLGRTDAAIQAYVKAVDLSLEAGLAKRAVALCRKVIRHLPERYDFYLRSARILSAEGFLPDAKQDFLAFVEHARRNGEGDAAQSALLELQSLSTDESGHGRPRSSGFGRGARRGRAALAAVAAVLAGTLAGCGDELGTAPPVEESEETESLEDITIPQGFAFNTSRDVTVQLAVGPDSTERDEAPRVQVGFPATGSEIDLVMEGFLSTDGEFTTVIPVATWRESLVIRYESGDGVQTVEAPIVNDRVDVPGTSLSRSFSVGSIPPAFSAQTFAGGPARVPEDLSQFPIAYTSYHPSQSTYGTIAFEDNWPSKGDYDFNDLVLSYHLVMYRTPAYDVVAMELFLNVEAVGAEYRNGFGFSLPVSRQRVITAYGGVSNRVDELGMEPGHDDDAVFIVFDNPSTVMGREASMLNTLPGSSFVDSPEIRFVVQFRTPLRDSDLGTPPFNPFLFVNGDRGREVHLIGKPPTALANPAYSGSADDAGNYRTQQGLPWAILVPATWSWPAERVPVNEGHLEFVPWAESGGAQYTDWYLSKGSNRDDSRLYIR
jgi:LruC domain-containing protein